MKRYIKAILGGFLAVLAAFGWIVAIAFFAMLKGDTIVGIEINKGWVLVPAFLVFAVGFFIAFRFAYSRNSS